MSPPENYNIYIGDLHIHSSYSDGKSSIKEIILTARKVGFDFIAITDHNQVEGSKQAKLLAEKSGLGLLVISGEEISAPWGHLLALKIENQISHKITPQEVCKEAHQQGGYVFASHPYWLDTREEFWDKGLFDSLLAKKDIDGLELINCEAVPPYDNLPVIQKYYSLRMKEKFYPVIGSSDAHEAESLGKEVRMYVLAESLTEEHIMDAILRGRCVIEWQKRYYGEDKYFSEIDMWFRESFISHLQQCQEEVT
jgi:hypothetical protein